MQINSISAAQSFKGAEGGKKINKKAAIAAGVAGAAVVAGVVVAGLHGKKIAGEQIGEEATKGLKAIFNYVKDGAVDLIGVARKHAVDIIDTVKNKFSKGTEAASDVVEELADDVVS